MVNEVTTAESGASHGTARRARVLVIDDEPMIVKTLRRVLQGEHEVVIAEEGGAALEQIAQDGRFDAIFCDVHLPGISGPALHAELSRRAPALADRMTFMTGGACDDATMEFLTHLGATRLLSKPFGRAEIFAHLDRALQAEIRP